MTRPLDERLLVWLVLGTILTIVLMSSHKLVRLDTNMEAATNLIVNSATRAEEKKRMDDKITATITCPDGTTHQVTTCREEGESWEDFLIRHKERVRVAKEILCGG